MPALDPATQVLPVNGTREALFAFAQTVVDRTRAGARGCPNPFYQIYEGAALLAGAHAALPATTCRRRTSACAFEAVVGARVARRAAGLRLLAGNPTGHVMTLDEWKQLFELSDRHGFVIASDECYSEIYFDEGEAAARALAGGAAARARGLRPPGGVLSLSKRSNVPGMRSGFVAGDADADRSSCSIAPTTAAR